MLKISEVKTDGGTQTRANLNHEIINNYSEEMLNEIEFPPVVVFYDGSNYWLADGFHRIEASKKAGFTEIEAEIKQGTRRDAVLYSVGANSNHGLPRSNQDKRNAVMTLLNDDEWMKWSDREIARRCCVGKSFVSNMRKNDTVHGGQYEKTFIHPKTGKESTMNTSSIGKANTEKEQDKPTQESVNIYFENKIKEDEITETTGHETEHDYLIETDSVGELVLELFSTVYRRFSKLKKSDMERAVLLLVKKLKELSNE